jgi:uncharacterized protein
MKNIESQLNHEELERLDLFLLERIDQDAYSEGMDEGIFNISELDGLFTAIVSGPTLIAPSQWLPVVWGDFEPEWKSEKESEEIFSLMFRHINDIAAILSEQPHNFEPLFMEHSVEGEAYAIVDEWCEGYIRGVSLATIQWESGGGKMTDLLLPILTFASEQGWDALDKLSKNEIEKIQQAIAPSAREIHAWWLAQRTDGQSSPIQRTSPRVGRNDPCPCGSGKKYKKCCLH